MTKSKLIASKEKFTTRKQKYIYCSEVKINSCTKEYTKLYSCFEKGCPIKVFSKSLRDNIERHYRLWYMLLKFIGYFPDYLSVLPRTFLRFFGQPLSKQLPTKVISKRSFISSDLQKMIRIILTRTGHLSRHHWSRMVTMLDRRCLQAIV